VREEKPATNVSEIRKHERVIAKVVKEVPSVTPRQKKQIKEHINSTIKKEYGARQESLTIKHIEKVKEKPVTDNNKYFYSRHLGQSESGSSQPTIWEPSKRNPTVIFAAGRQSCDVFLPSLTQTIRIDPATPYYIGGRVDGFVGGKLLEIKNRTRRIPPQVPFYDRLQFQSYLYILGIEEGVLMERLLAGKKEETKETVIHRDHQEWNTKLLPPLAHFCYELIDFLKKPDLHLEWFSKPDDKEIILKRVLKALPRYS